MYPLTGRRVVIVRRTLHHHHVVVVSCSVVLPFECLRLRPRVVSRVLVLIGMNSVIAMMVSERRTHLLGNKVRGGSRSLRMEGIRLRICLPTILLSKKFIEVRHGSQIGIRRITGIVEKVLAETGIMRSI